MQSWDLASGDGQLSENEARDETKIRELSYRSHITQEKKNEPPNPNFYICTIVYEITTKKKKSQCLE
jgi:hypothetical protein